MKMILEMKYRREKRLIYSKSEICELYLSEDISLILSRSPYLSNISNEVFVYKAKPINADFIEVLAIELRKNYQVYISFEDALSRWGVISQIPMRLIVATTGESGEYSTEFGVIEFIHVEHSEELIIENTLDTGYPLRLAKKLWCYEDLKRIGRNLHLIDREEL